ncbi:MAG: hypothetical protein H7222_07995 [Methylotenera sp.]|nr:hypothetical protein [Oligoflexia bacterium]
MLKAVETAQKWSSAAVDVQPDITRCSEDRLVQTALKPTKLECNCERPAGESAGTEAGVNPSRLLLIREFKSVDALPSGLRKLAEAGRIMPGLPIKVVIRETNDLMITPVGLLAFVVEPKTQDHTQKSFDDGYTHALDIEVSKTSAKGITYTLHLGSALYTMADGRPSYNDGEGHETIPIFFTEQNVLSFLADNEKSALNSGKKDALLWKAGAGIQILNSDHINAWAASGQQQTYHKLAKNVPGIHQYIYDQDGMGIRESAFLDLAVGLTHQIGQKGNCQFRVTGTVEPKIFSTLANSDIATRVSLDAYKVKPKNTLSMKLGADTVVHPEGVEFAPMVVLGYERKRWGISTSVRFPTGTLQNNVNYNWTPHPENTLAIYTFIGSGKKSGGKK